MPVTCRLYPELAALVLELRLTEIGLDLPRPAILLLLSVRRVRACAMQVLVPSCIWRFSH